MISRNDIIDAIAKCVGYDPIHAPKSSEIITAAWLEHFEDYRAIGRVELLQAITEYYRTPDRKWPQPADISAIIAAVVKDRRSREDDSSSMEMGVSGGEFDLETRYVDVYIKTDDGRELTNSEPQYRFSWDGEGVNKSQPFVGRWASSRSDALREAREWMMRGVR